MATHSSILAGKNPMDKEAWQATVHDVAKSPTRLSDLSTEANAFNNILSSPPHIKVTSTMQFVAIL